MDYYLNDGIIHLLDFDEKEVFNTGETGTSSFYRSGIRNLLEGFNTFDKIQYKLNVDNKAFEWIVIEAVEDFYEYEFKGQFSKNQ